MSQEYEIEILDLTSDDPQHEQPVSEHQDEATAKPDHTQTPAKQTKEQQHAKTSKRQHSEHLDSDRSTMEQPKCSATSNKRRRIDGEETTSRQGSENLAAESIVETPLPLPRKEKQKLMDIPELPDRYIKSYVDPCSPTPYRDPQSFSTKPPYWMRWHSKRYMRLIDYVRERLDLVDFATQERLSVEEVQEVLGVTVCDDIWAKMEKSKKLRRRAEERMKEHFRQLNENGEQPRSWTEKKIRGELDKIVKGAIEIIDEHGNKITIKYNLLRDKDKRYLKGKTTDEDQQNLQWKPESKDAEAGDNAEQE